MTPFRILLSLIIAKAVWSIWMIQVLGVGLSPDEAQYWLWGQHLDWAYYSKPGGIAWELAASTSLFGNSDLGVRLVAVMNGSLVVLAMYWLGLCCGLKDRQSLWAALLTMLSPLGVIASFAATTDTPFLIFWILGCGVMAHSLRLKEPLPWLLLGLCVATAGLFKFPHSAFLWAVAIGCASYTPSWRRPLPFLMGIGVSTLGLLPGFIWNLQHNWAGYRHILGQLSGGTGQGSGLSLQPDRFIEFWGSQLGVLSPIFFVLLAISIWQSAKSWKNLSPSLRMCLLCSGSLLAMAALRSLLGKVQANWFVAAYPTAFILVAWSFVNKKAHRALRWGAGISIALCLVAFSIPCMQMRGWSIPYKFNPFRHEMGWDRLSKGLKGYPEGAIFISDSYQSTSILGFYGPEKTKSYFFNLSGARHNQFSYWPGYEGEDAYFVVLHNNDHFMKKMPRIKERYDHLLQEYFTESKMIQFLPIFQVAGKTVKGALIWRCEGFRGKFPAESKTY